MEVTFRNPLKVSLALSSLSLLWRFTVDGSSSSKEMTEETITNEETSAVGVGNMNKYALRNCDLFSPCF